MVFKPFTTLARQSISKHLVNGYAQSVVAATQSSYASSTVQLARLGQQNAPARLHTAFGGANSGRAAPGKDGQGSDGLNSYYAVQSQDNNENDGKKYLFSRKILWSKAQHQEQQKQLLEKPLDFVVEPLSRSRSSSFVREYSTAESDGSDKIADEVAIEDGPEDEVTSELAGQSSAAVEEELQSQTSASEKTAVADTPSSPITAEYNEKLRLLRVNGQYNEVVAVFEHMVKEKIPLDICTYNQLLSSLVALHPDNSHRIINVYQDMLRQKIPPNTETYIVLIEFLAADALHTHEWIERMSADATRFGFLANARKAAIENLRKENSLTHALGLFYAGIEVRADRVFPEHTYALLIDACAKYRQEQDMLKVYTHMELHNVRVSLRTIASLIEGFGRVGNTTAAVETYNNYQATPAARDPDRIDMRYMIYGNLIRSYIEAGEAADGLSFLEKVVNASVYPAHSKRLAEAAIDGFLAVRDVESAREWILRLDTNDYATAWLVQTLAKVSDLSLFECADKLYNAILARTDVSTQKQMIGDAQKAFLALCNRTGRVDKARDLWADMEISGSRTIGGSVAYTRELYEHGFVNEALVVLNHFSEYYIEKATLPKEPSLRIEFLMDGYEYMINELASRGSLTPVFALDICGFSMYHCGRVGYEASKLVLTMFEGPIMQTLGWPQLDLLLQVQSGVLQQAKEKGLELRPEDIQRFEMMFNTALGARLPMRDSLKASIDKAVSILSTVNADLAGNWNACLQGQLTWNGPAVPAAYGTYQIPSEEMTVSPTIVAGEVENIMDDNFDPYWPKIDTKASHIIDNLLNPPRVKLPEARKIYRDTRRAGKLIRMTSLGRLVAAASRSKIDETTFIQEIYRNAKKEMPLLMEYRSLRYGWCFLLDAMVAAYLNLENREMATMYHEEMLKFGASPSANTYGLYIVSLKSSVHIYDEATEAVKIFERAKAENVVPSSFLYNALIGKLAKARRVEDCLFYFAEMRAIGVKPTSVTYGTMINALTRVGDENFAEELFQEMEAMPNYKPRPAPYNSLMQFFVSSKRDKGKVMTYFNRMTALGIEPTSHTYKVLIEAHATLDAPDLEAAEGVLDMIKAKGERVEPAHHAALIHAKGCVLQNADAALAHFSNVIESREIPADQSLYQALFESLVANHRVHETDRWLKDMGSRGIIMTAYIANTLIHGWALEKNIEKAKTLYNALSSDENAKVKREPSTYEAMTRAYLAVEDREGAMTVVEEMHTRGYPAAVMARVMDLVRGRGEWSVAVEGTPVATVSA
ncbi:hypothetical protein RUND412_002169 [Rhizina undulata]